MVRFPGSRISFWVLFLSAVLLNSTAVFAGPASDPFVGDFVGSADDGKIYLHIQKTEAGFIMAGLDLPGPMPPDISGGGTGIFINGREIHPMDQLGLHQLFGITYRGRYWLDARGNLGLEGGPALVNIVSAIQAAQKRQPGGSTTHGYGSTYGARGTLAGDGQGGHMYSGRTAAGKSVFWYPGM